jgi:hypothetical protein
MTETSDRVEELEARVEQLEAKLDERDSDSTGVSRRTALSGLAGLAGLGAAGGGLFASSASAATASGFVETGELRDGNGNTQVTLNNGGPTSFTNQIDAPSVSTDQATIGFLNLGGRESAIIDANGVIDISQNLVTVRPNSGSSDSLNRIEVDGQSPNTGEIVILRGTGGNTINVKDGAGNLDLQAKRVLDAFTDILMLVSMGGGDFSEVAFADNA